MQILVIFWDFEQRTSGGGLTLKRKIMKPAHFVFQSYWVVLSTWQSFIEMERWHVSPLPGPLVNSVLKCPYHQIFIFPSDPSFHAMNLSEKRFRFG